MRIRKLAGELGVDPLLVLGWLRELGYGRYHDPEQQLGPDVEQRLRIHQRDLPRIARSYLPPSSPKALVTPPTDADVMAALKGVKRLDERPPAPAKKGGPTRPPAARMPAPDPAVLALQSEKAAAERALLTHTRARESAEAEREQLRRTLAEQQAELLACQARADAALAEQDRLRADLDALRTAHDQLRAERDQLRQERTARPTDPAGPALTPLRAVFERRGLRSDDEMSLALRALLEARRLGELLPLLGTADPEELQSLLERRLVLLAEGDDEPAGVAVLRVPTERSEGEPPSAVRDALRRFSTACLIHNLKGVVIVGGSPAYHRALKEGVDSRVKLRLVPGNARGHIPEFPSAELVIVWAATILDHRVSQRFPNALVIPHRGISRMLAAATEWIEAR